MFQWNRILGVIKVYSTCRKCSFVAEINCKLCFRSCFILRQSDGIILKNDFLLGMGKQVLAFLDAISATVENKVCVH